MTDGGRGGVDCWCRPRIHIPSPVAAMSDYAPYGRVLSGSNCTGAVAQPGWMSLQPHFSVCGLQGAVLGGCNCAEGESTKSVALPVAPLPSCQRGTLAVPDQLRVPAVE